MVQELNSKENSLRISKKNNLRIAVVGAGPAGCMCAYCLQNEFDVTLFDGGSPLRTILATGGGRCNLAHAEFDFRELAKYYPRGEKFLYSVFSQFATGDTLDFFNNLGVETYVQDDMRIFPISDSAKDVRDRFLSALKKSKIKREKVLRINPPYFAEGIQPEKLNNSNNSNNEEVYEIVTDFGSYDFDKIVIASGGHSNYELISQLGHNIIPPKPALVGLKTKENFKNIAGVSFKNVCAKFNRQKLYGDIIFTHEGVSGPLVYTISSLMARAKFPYTISFDFCGEIDLQLILNENSQKAIKNLLSELVPKSFALFILEKSDIFEDEKSHKINGKMRDEILELLNDFKVTVLSPLKEGEVVTSGGVDLKEVTPKTLNSKLFSGIYFCGEVLDIDGLCGGFNLQNCWSTGYVVAQGITKDNHL